MFTTILLIRATYRLFVLFTRVSWWVLSTLCITVPVAVLAMLAKPVKVGHDEVPAERIAKLHPAQRSVRTEQRTAAYVPAVVVVADSDRVMVSR